MDEGTATGAPPGAPGGPSQGPASDLEALTQFKLASAVSVGGSAVGTAVSVSFSSGGYLNLANVSTGPALSVNVSLLYFVLAIDAVGVMLLIASLAFYRLGFLELRTVDDRFESSPTYVLAAILGIVVVGLGSVLTVGAFLEILSCAGPGNAIPASCVDLTSVFGGLALLIIGAIVVLIGYIGTLVAIWRLASRYGDSLFKIGAVLLIFPLLAVVGSILIFLAVSKAEARLRQAPRPVWAPSVPTPPPPLH